MTENKSLEGRKELKNSYPLTAKIQETYQEILIEQRSLEKRSVKKKKSTVYQLSRFKLHKKQTFIKTHFQLHSLQVLLQYQSMQNDYYMVIFVWLAI